MNDTDLYKEVAARYGFPPVPDCVVRLTRLIANQDAGLEDIAVLVKQDKALAARLVRAANPRAESDADYTVETVDEALMRIGIGSVLLIAMGPPLMHALAKTCERMLAQKLEIFPNAKSCAFNGTELFATIDFVGKAAGHVNLRFPQSGARNIAATILGLPAAELNNPADINDAIGELLNIIAGNLKSNLCDAGLSSTLSPPRVGLISEFKVQPVPGSALERMCFKVLDVPFMVELSVNPWSN